MRLGPIWRLAGHERGIASIAAVALGALVALGGSAAYVVVSPQVADTARTDSTSQAGSVPVHASPTFTPGPPMPTLTPPPSTADLLARLMVSPEIAYARQLSLDAAGWFDTEREIVVRYLNGDLQRFDAVGPVRTSSGVGPAEQRLLIKLQWRDADGNPVELFISPDGVATIKVHYKDTKREFAP